MDIYTIGHSTLTIASFLYLLQQANIHCLVDIRSYPSSRTNPQFNQELLQKTLENHHISYIHIASLGGRRNIKTQRHASIREKAFSSYAAYMETKPFQEGIHELETIASHCKTAFMCSEAVWWKCHRRMVSDFLVSRGWNVIHLGVGKTNPSHTIWDIARIQDGKLIYDQ